jgi:tripartite-type tricarboxylate transporter receptor subunit TctC
MKRKSFVAAMLVLACACAPATWAQQTYPTKPVRVVVAVPAGGSIDLVARLVGQKLTESLGQTFVIDNRPGAAGIIGTEHVAKSAPDGYTLAMSPTGFIASHPSVFSKLPYDPARELAPVIKVVIQPAVLVVPPAAPYKSVAELVAFAKANPGKLNYGSGGDGSPHHFSGVMFGTKTETKMVHVAYKGGAPAMQDLLGGRVDLIFAPVPEALPHVKGGKLRALAVMSDRRTPVLQDVPTMQEAGLSGLELDTWIGLLAPAGTPRDIVAKLNATVEKALAGDLRERFAEVGLSAAGGTPEQFAATIREEMATYARLVKASGMAIQ